MQHPSSTGPTAKAPHAVDARAGVRHDGSRDAPAPAAPIPARDPLAATGRAFIATLAGLSADERESAIRRELLAGNLPSFLRRLREVRVVGTQGGAAQRSLSFDLMPDYLAIGSDDDFVRMPMTPLTAQAFCDAYGFVLPTRKMVDDIWRSAAAHAQPRAMSRARESVITFMQHNAIIEAQFAGQERGAFVSGVKKDVVLSNRLAERPGRVAIYGWHAPGGEPVQPLFVGHAQGYVDYSHGIRPVRRLMRIDGQPTTFDAIAADPALHPLLSDEGVLRVTRYPTATQAPGRDRVTASPH